MKSRTTLNRAPFSVQDPRVDDADVLIRLDDAAPTPAALSRLVRIAAAATDPAELSRAVAEAVAVTDDDDERTAIDAIAGMARERLELRERVIALTDANSDLVRRAAHALRTPVATIGVAASALSGPSLPSASTRKLIAQIETAVDELRPLLARLLRLAEVETATGPLDLARVDIGQLARCVAGAMNEVGAVSIDVEGGRAIALADRDVVIEILSAVMSAAARGAGTGATVRTEVGEREVTVTITAGAVPAYVRPGALELIAFGPSVFAGDTPREGVDLATARRLAERSGGRLRAEVDHAGRLSFVLGLPTEGAFEDR